MTELLYLDNSYLKEFDAKVIGVTAEGLVFDKTAFYPEGGGQPSDTGWIRWEGGTSEVTHVLKKEDSVYHVIEEPFPDVGVTVRGILNWERRYRNMRYHTALHILAGVVYNLYGSTVTGSQIGEDRARIDFTLEDLSRERVETIESEANKIVEEGRRVLVRFLDRDELLRNPHLIRIKMDLIPKIPVLRIVEIEGFDAQPDGGTHVSNTKEVGRIRIVKTVNKGRFNKRLEIVLEEI